MTTGWRRGLFICPARQLRQYAARDVVRFSRRVTNPARLRGDFHADTQALFVVIQVIVKRRSAMGFGDPRYRSVAQHPSLSVRALRFHLANTVTALLSTVFIPLICSTGADAWSITLIAARRRRYLTAACLYMTTSIMIGAIARAIGISTVCESSRVQLTPVTTGNCNDSCRGRTQRLYRDYYNLSGIAATNFIVQMIAVKVPHYRYLFNGR